MDLERKAESLNLRVFFRIVKANDNGYKTNGNITYLELGRWKSQS